MGLASLYTLIASIILMALLGKQVMPSVVQNVKTTKVNKQIIETEKNIYEAICRYIIIEQSNPSTITDLVNKNYLLAGINNNGFGGTYAFSINTTKGTITISTDISDITIRTMFINSYKNTFKPVQGTGNTVDTTFVFPTTVMHGSGIVSKSIPIQSTAPALTNKYWYDTSGTEAVLKISDGTSWKILSSSPSTSIGSTISTSPSGLPTTGVSTGEVKYVYDSSTNGIQQYTYYNGAWVASSSIGASNLNNYIKLIAGVRQWSDGTYATSCLKYIQSEVEGYSYRGDIGDGTYKIDIDGVGGAAPIDVYCDQTTDGGGWTMVTLLNTMDSKVRRGTDSFWTNTNGTGTLNNSDYMSSFFASSYIPKDILLSFSYNNNDSNISAAFTNSSNTLNFYSLLNLPISNNNINFSKYYTNNSVSNSFFGSNLSFQVGGDANNSDQFRIWYNTTNKATCNQTGGIGTEGDIALNSWWIEAGFTSSYSLCQENVYRSYLGTNKGGTHPVITNSGSETLLSPSDIYTTNYVKIYIR